MDNNNSPSVHTNGKKSLSKEDKKKQKKYKEDREEFPSVFKDLGKPPAKLYIYNNYNYS